MPRQPKRPRDPPGPEGPSVRVPPAANRGGGRGHHQIQCQVQILGQSVRGGDRVARRIYQVGFVLIHRRMSTERMWDRVAEDVVSEPTATGRTSSSGETAIASPFY
ncbi:hypothetical protein R1sor_026873 [Riccia sorocarpa]|uniref:Uncharacterized protein n=1 Tax=Riccia sorocarpa TaxID=122646 RepID=A0ABD3GFT0_9MARC